ncbi:SUKH-4 family immunity protein [Kitasatospora camelliae]|uniref:SUKH-4 family immunity protein n=1 Tax=Kitasatospora camelliae TaxID=3156397 RepID=A0AAU8K1I2_9ACTN
MVTTYAQAQEIAEDWINAGVPRSRQREVRVREFDLGFVCWAEDSDTGDEGSGIRLVIARDSGASTLWPPLPVNEVVRQFEELYGADVEPNPAGAARPVPGQIEATSFLLSPPQWLQEAGAAAIEAEAAKLGTAPAAPVPAQATPAPGVLTTPPESGRPAGDAPTMLAPPSAQPGPASPPVPPGVPVPPGAPGLPGSENLTVPMPAPAVHAPLPDGATPPMPAAFSAPPAPPGPAPVPPPPGHLPPAPPAVEQAPTLLAPPDGIPPLPGAVPPAGPGVAHAPTVLAAPGDLPPRPEPAAPGGGSIAYAPTMLATDGPPGLMGLPGAPGQPGPAGAGAPGRGGPGAPPPPPPGELRGGGASPAGGALGRGGPGVPPPPPPGELRGEAGGPAGGALGRGGPGAPPPPPPGELRGGAPTPPVPPAGQAGGPASSNAAQVAYQATQLAPALDLPGAGAPPAPPVPGVPGVPGRPPAGGPAAPPPPPPGAVPVPGAPPAGYGYPVAGVPAGPPPVAAAPPTPAPVAPAPAAAPGVPAIGPGTQAVVSYRGPDGSEQTLLMRSEPGTPHPEWKALHELRRLGVPPDQVLELHTDLELCDLPGGYCARMVNASWPNVRISHTVPYGRDLAGRQSGMALLHDHLDQLHQLAAAPQRPRPVRAPLPPPGTVHQLPPLPPQQLAGELGQAFGPGVFRFEQRAVSRQGVPEPVAQTLMWAGLPREFPPFFWAQAQEGRPIPTLAELAAERGLPGAPEFGGYLVLGSDYGRQLCVQYGTAAVVAVDMERPGEPPRFVNTGVPEFVRSMAVLGRMWRLRYGLTPDQAGRWTTDFQAQLLAVDPAALLTPESWWAVLLEQLWDGLM